MIGRFLLVASLAVATLSPPVGAAGTADSERALLQYRCATLRAAVADLAAVHGSRYPKGREYLRRLDKLSGIVGDRVRIEGLADSLEQLKREALLANPLLDFDRVLVVKRRGLRRFSPQDTRISFPQEPGADLGLPSNHECNASLPREGYDNEIAVLSLAHPEAELVTLPSIHERLEAAETNFCLGCHVARDRYYAIGSILGAGSMIQWLAALLWPNAQWGREEALQALTQAAAESPLGAYGLYILPHLAGAGSPQRDSTARGVVVGLTLRHSRADLARAAIESLAFELRLLWEALERFTHQPLERIVVVGGGARNRLWTQIKADVTGRKLIAPQHVEAVTLGAALLAGVGVGVYRQIEEIPHILRNPSTPIEPQEENRQRYDERYRLLIAHIHPLAAQLGHLGPALDPDYR